MSSIEIADAYVTLTTKMPGVKKDIESAIGGVDTEGAGREIGKKTRGGMLAGFGVGGAVAGVVGVVTAAVASSIGGLVSEAVAASDATDKFKKTLDFAKVDPTSIDALTKSTRAYADATVYDLADIQNTTAQLASNGIKGYAELTEAAGNLNAVAGGNAETFKSVGMVLTQTAGQGKLTTENWNQLADAIPGASGALQDALVKAGAYTGNFRDAMAAGEITAEEFNAALMELGTDPVAVEAAKSTATLEGALGNLNATIVGGLSDAITAIKPGLTALINGFSEVLGWVFQFIGGLGQSVDLSMFTEVLGFLSPIGFMLQVLQPLLPMIVDMFTQLGGVFSGVLATVLPVIAQALTMVAGVFTNVLSAVLPVVIPLIVELASMFGLLAAQIIPMVLPIISELAVVFNEVLHAVMPIILALAGALMPIIQALIPVVVAVLGAFLPLISALVEALAPILTTVADIIAAVLVPVLDTVIGVIKWLADVVMWAVREIIAPYFQGVVIPVVKEVGRIFSDVFGGLGDFFAGIWKGIERGFRGFINFIIDGINGFISGLNGVGGFLSEVTGGAIDFSIGRIPRLADGAVVSARPGGILANIGEGRYDEAVVPLSPPVLSQLGGGGLKPGDELVLVVDGQPIRGIIQTQVAAHDASQMRVTRGRTQTI